ncbi:MAG: hypothetical protein COU81_00180 [Candidatus Portnoybacteria bacterium CG10_big_fil_rev_8_21_14_0_10_36_7]|uniref:ATP-dependent Clp protease proteolytic subunit n=1 Tax=Candidatus Portnoybacteria bacterium CG10_big_fil_rev_8_21_14_0_10_36_7 TaxID=1974812 RepID=A0A2M8KF55_9BACT|nr:MAG: hypothetical protein COU81_00180 [Candidatus Portnoybacteria bacterium CG10_big_fil_rev_8_21_14_0_10_36_7]
MWKYEHIDETRQQLLSKGIIDLSGDIDEDMAMYIRESLMILATKGNPDIKIIITSNGGNVGVGLAIYDMLRIYPGRVTGEAKSFCRSMATVILQACDHRMASANSKIKIHNVLVKDLSLSVLRNPQKITKLIASLEADQKIINNIYSLRTGRSLKKITRESDKDIIMTAQEALEFGLIDEII